MKSIIHLLPLVSLFILFTSCGPTRVSTTTGAMYERDDLYANSWDLVELNGVTVARTGDRYSYLTFTPNTNRISGYTGCNFYGGTITMSGNDGITVYPTVRTKNTCAGNTVDARLVNSLGDIDRWAIVNDKLVMYNDGKVVARWSPSTYTNKDLIGEWQLSHVSDNSVPFDVLYPASNRPTLVFASDKNVISGTTGYNTYSCPVTVNSNGIAVADCTATKVECPSSAETIYFNGLKNINNYSFADDGTLVLIADDNTVMKFTRIK